MKIDWLDILYFILLVLAAINGRASRSGNIYLMQDGDTFKIGRTSRAPEERYKDFKTGNPDIKLIHHFPARDMYTAEKGLHNKYKSKRIAGTEWFKLSGRDVRQIKAIKYM